MSKSAIEWTEQVWNPVTGCTRVSRGCDNCYAVSMTRRLSHIPATQEKYAGLVDPGKNHFNGTVRLHEDLLGDPLGWRKPRVVFVNSMSDLFHPGVPFAFIDKVFAVMALTPRHTYQILTKRPARMAEYLTNRDPYCGTEVRIMTELDVLGFEHPKLFDLACEKAADIAYEGLPLENVWLGTSVEDQPTADERMPHLLQCPASVRFLSCEPLLGPVDLLNSSGWGSGAAEFWGQDIADHLHWVIAGGESGAKARPMDPDWARGLRDQCQAGGIPFFFKQWGLYRPAGPDEFIPERVYRYGPALDGRVWRFGKKGSGRILDGHQWNEMPTPIHQPITP